MLSNLKPTFLSTLIWFPFTLCHRIRLFRVLSDLLPSSDSKYSLHYYFLFQHDWNFPLLAMSQMQITVFQHWWLHVLHCSSPSTSSKVWCLVLFYLSSTCSPSDSLYVLIVVISTAMLKKFISAVSPNPSTLLWLTASLVLNHRSKPIRLNQYLLISLIYVLKKLLGWKVCTLQYNDLNHML